MPQGSVLALQTVHARWLSRPHARVVQPHGGGTRPIGTSPALRSASKLMCRARDTARRPRAGSTTAAVARGVHAGCSLARRRSAQRARGGAQGSMPDAGRHGRGQTKEARVTEYSRSARRVDVWKRGTQSSSLSSYERRTARALCPPQLFLRSMLGPRVSAMPRMQVAAVAAAPLLHALRDASVLHLTMEHSTRVPWASAQPAWTSLRQHLLASVHTDLPQSADAAPSTATITAEARQLLPCQHIQAVAAHARSSEQLEQRLFEASSVSAALLLVSGDGTKRPAGTPTSTPQLLRTAARLRSAGRLPADLALFAAANPLCESAQALVPKLQSGAEALLTQPALLPARASRWWEGAVRHTSGVPVLLGIAFLTCPRDCVLWLRLAGVDAQDADAQTLLMSWQAAADAGADALSAHAEQSLRDAVAHAGSLQGIGGMHAMPLTPAGYALAARVLPQLLSGGDVKEAATHLSAQR